MGHPRCVAVDSTSRPDVAFWSIITFSLQIGTTSNKTKQNKKFKMVRNTITAVRLLWNRVIGDLNAKKEKERLRFIFLIFGAL